MAAVHFQDGLPGFCADREGGADGPFAEQYHPGRPWVTVRARWGRLVRSPVYGARGMAATAQPLASRSPWTFSSEGVARWMRPLRPTLPWNCGAHRQRHWRRSVRHRLGPEQEALYGYSGSGRSPAGQDLDLNSRIEQLRSEGGLPKVIPAFPPMAPCGNLARYGRWLVCPARPLGQARYGRGSRAGSGLRRLGFPCRRS